MLEKYEIDVTKPMTSFGILQALKYYISTQTKIVGYMDRDI